MTYHLTSCERKKKIYLSEQREGEEGGRGRKEGGGERELRNRIKRRVNKCHHPCVANVIDRGHLTSANANNPILVADINIFFFSLFSWQFNIHSSNSYYVGQYPSFFFILDNEKRSTYFHLFFFFSFFLFHSYGEYMK